MHIYIYTNTYVYPYSIYVCNFEMHNNNLITELLASGTGPTVTTTGQVDVGQAGVGLPSTTASDKTPLEDVNVCVAAETK